MPTLTRRPASISTPTARRCASASQSGAAASHLADRHGRLAEAAAAAARAPCASGSKAAGRSPPRARDRGLDSLRDGTDERGQADRRRGPAGGEVRGHRRGGERQRFRRSPTAFSISSKCSARISPPMLSSARAVSRDVGGLFRDGARRTVAVHIAQPCSQDATMAALPLSLHPDRLLPGRSRHPRPRPRALRHGRRPADRQSARAHRSAVVRGRRAVSRRVRALHHAGPLCLPHALQPGHPARGPRHPAPRRRRGGAGRAQDLAHVRRALSPVSRHADAHLARPRVRDGVRLHGAADRRIGRSHVRPHQRVPRAAGVPSARAVRALQHRSARDHRVAARSARAAPEAARVRLEGPRDHGVPARSRSSIPNSRASATTCCSSARSRGEDTATWRGYLAAHRERRAYFKTMGATSTDHGHPTARTCDLPAERVPAPARPRARGHRDARTKPSSSAGRC